MARITESATGHLFEHGAQSVIAHDAKALQALKDATGQFATAKAHKAPEPAAKAAAVAKAKSRRK